MSDKSFDFEYLKNQLNAGLTANGTIREELVIEIEKFAAALCEGQITQSSIRKIYNSFKALQFKMQQELMVLVSRGVTGDTADVNFEDAMQKVFLKIKPLIRLMKSKSKYVIERNKEKQNIIAYENLQEFISTCVDKINNVEEFNAFMDLFECIIANLKEERGGKDDAVSKNIEHKENFKSKERYKNSRIR